MQAYQDIKSTHIDNARTHIYDFTVFYTVMLIYWFDLDNALVLMLNFLSPSTLMMCWLKPVNRLLLDKKVVATRLVNNLYIFIYYVPRHFHKWLNMLHF